MLRSVGESSLTLRRYAPGSSLIARWRAAVTHKRFRRNLVRASLIILNAGFLLTVVAVVALNPSHSGGTPLAKASAADAQSSVRPVDLSASVNIASTVAHMTNLPEAGDVSELVNTQRIELAVASTNSAIVNKPQIIPAKFPSNKDITTYTAAAGDTLSSIAANFGISTDSILWSNGLLSDHIVAGEKLLIPPVSGIVYTVKSGDTAASLARQYRSNEAKITLMNDADLAGLSVGERIIIPDGQIVVQPTFYSGFASGFAWGASAIYGYNGYAWGNCTWYVATQIAVPANWGNAATWAAGARAAGWRVSSVPTPGAIAQNSYSAGGLGHVAIVNQVSADGSLVYISDMNGIAGFDRVGYAWQPTSTYQNYITRN